MATFEVKTQSLAVRCEICHQADLFEPATGFCMRCAGVETAFVTQKNDHPTFDRGPHLEYIGPGVFSIGRHVRNIALGGVVGSLPLSLIPAFLFLLSGFDQGYFTFLCLAVGVSFVPGAFTGFWFGSLLHHLPRYQTIARLRESGAAPAVSATIGLMLLLVFYLFLESGFESALNTLGPLTGLTAVLAAFNALGGMLVSVCLTNLERKNLRVRRN